MCEVLIVHTIEAEEWANYLKNILEASRNFPEESVILHLVDGESYLQQADLSVFSHSRCILLLLSTVFLDIQREPGVLETFRKLLYPSQKVIAFLCGVSENEEFDDYFEDWVKWRKLYAEDEPRMYVSTVLESIADASEDVLENYTQEKTENDIITPPHTPPDYEIIVQTPSPHDITFQTQPDNDFTIQTSPEDQITPQVLSEDVRDPDGDEDSPSHAEVESRQSNQNPETDGWIPQTDQNNSLTSDTSQTETSTHQPSFIVQPDRILCGSTMNIYIIMAIKLDSQAKVEVEFSCQNSTAKLVPGTFVNEYTVSFQSPDMPAGEVMLTLYSNASAVCSGYVTYFSAMEEINSLLDKLADPLQFMCQAFAITSNFTESLDTLLTDSLKQRLPATGLQVFGISQLEHNNSSTNQQNMELPTLLHFSAKYGLRELTTVLLQCPGALQAYSVANKDGDYPNRLAEKNGFSDLRHFMDKYLESAGTDLPSTEEVTTPEQEDIYEPMSNAQQDLSPGYSLHEDIYMSMMELNPECAEDLYEDMASALENSQNPEETMLRKFFQVKSDQCLTPVEEGLSGEDYKGEEEEENIEVYGDEEDLYNMCFPDQIYDTVDGITPEIINRPPAPIPRPSMNPEPVENKTYISRVFSSHEVSSSLGNPPDTESSTAPVRPVRDRVLSSAYDPYAGMKTPGQRQLIVLQERVKVGALTVEEAVQEFKAWQFDQERRSQSLRFQQENLQRLRDSITRRHKEKRSSKDDLEITAPIQRNLQWGSHMKVECSVYEPSPRTVAPPPLVSRPLQRRTWQTGSTSSTSSSGSNRLSTHSTFSYSSGADGEYEEAPDCPLPPRPPRINETPPVLPPPRIPPRLPERLPDMLNERYVSSPTRALPQLPPHRPIPPPPIPRRPR
ncbi:phosphoinositide 3-kinase adapter protein 1 [Chanos chanos]|uniref:Phosphoinositide 3-kinase adapter protein 1 n=1 Tax=Chanos chanos TaxID=29144 RepID=A0A6J2VA67_CHACN|nr:phosphoinositide 3-kinase adapter protein 1 [Chanos chanos]